MKPHTRNAQPANLAVVDVVALRRGVRAVLDEKRAEIEDRPRYRDRGYLDDEGLHHAKGGFWNDTQGRATDGYSGQDVEDVRQALLERGLGMDFEAVDAMMNEYLRTGRLSLEITSPYAGVALAERRPTRTVVEVKKISADRYRVGEEVVTFGHRHARCSCRPEVCEHEILARRLRATWTIEPARFDVGDPKSRDVVRKVAQELSASATGCDHRVGRPAQTPEQRVLALLVRELFAADEFERAKAACERAGFFKRFPVSSLTSFRKDGTTATLALRLAEKLGSRAVADGSDPIRVLISAAALTNIRSAARTKRAA